MLNQVPIQVGRMARNVVLNHPNSMEIQMWRKVILRKDTGEVAGKPTLGGLGVLDSDDEDDIDWVYLGTGRALRAEMFQPSGMVDRNDANIGFSDEALFLIEPAANSGEEGFFDVRTHDVMKIIIRMPPNYENYATIAYEVTGRETTSDIPPFNIRYKCSLRDDLSFAPDGESSFFGTIEKIVRDIKSGEK